MTRFDEVARLKELQAAAKPGPWLVYNDPAIRCPTCKTEADGRYMMGLTHAPWLLEVAACFQPGDANEIAYAMDVLVSDSRYTGDPRVLTRLLRAAKIMEEKE